MTTSNHWDREAGTLARIIATGAPGFTDGERAHWLHRLEDAHIADGGTVGARLGLATTGQLLDEVRSRIDTDYLQGGGGPDYTTVTGRPDATDRPSA